MIDSRLRAPEPRRSPVHSTNPARWDYASLVAATTALPYCNHQTLAAHTMVRSNGQRVPRRETSLQSTPKPFAAPSTWRSWALLLRAPTNLIREILNHAEERQINASAPVTEARGRALNAPDSRKMRPTANQPRTALMGATTVRPKGIRDREPRHGERWRPKYAPWTDLPTAHHRQRRDPIQLASPHIVAKQEAHAECAPMKKHATARCEFSRYESVRIHCAP